MVVTSAFSIGFIFGSALYFLHNTIVVRKDALKKSFVGLVVVMSILCALKQTPEDYKNKEAEVPRK